MASSDYPAATVIDASDAARGVAAGEILLIDIRRPDEWRATGMAEGATGITLEDPEFLEKLGRVIAENPTRRPVLICRTGARTARALSLLADLGYQGVAHVAEGMAGSSHGPGWLQRGLPVQMAE